MNTAVFNYDADIKPLVYFAGRICHDLNNLITSSMGATSLLELKISMLPSVNLETEMERVNKSVNNYRAFTQRLSQIFFDVSETKIALDINLVLDSACENLSRPVEKHRLEQARKVMMDGTQISLAMGEIIQNAIDSSAPDGQISVQITNFQKNDKEWIKFTCQDQGKGIIPEHLPQVFTPFFSAGKRGNLVGLGLPRAGHIVYQHGSLVHIHSEPGKGTTVEFDLPVHYV